MESAELIAILHEVRDRVRAPQSGDRPPAPPDVALPDLMPLVHARDAALGKVAAIGTVNPRSGGLGQLARAGLEALPGAGARLARARAGGVQPQNGQRALDAAIEALSDTNRALIARAGATPPRRRPRSCRRTARTSAIIGPTGASIGSTSSQHNEVQFLRSVADLQGAFQHRADLMDASHRDLMRAQQRRFHGALERHGFDMQKRLWADLERIRLEYERLIYSELRTDPPARRRFAMPPAAPCRRSATPRSAAALQFDYGRFAERFRGTEEYVKAGQQFYLPYFAGAATCSISAAAAANFWR